MTFAEYQESTKLTAIFPYVKNEKGEDMKDMPLYVCLGLCGEVGEMVDKIWAIDDKDTPEHAKELVEGIESEISDVLWYTSEIATSLGVDLEEFFTDRKIYAIKNLKMANIFPLMSKALRICEITKKLWRDGNPATKRKQLYLEMKEFVSYLCAVADLMQFNIHDIFQKNIDKLSKRKDKNLLHGDGDKREQ